MKSIPLDLPSPSREVVTADRARRAFLPPAEIPHKRSVAAEVAGEEAVVAEANRAPRQRRVRRQVLRRVRYRAKPHRHPK